MFGSFLEGSHVCDEVYVRVNVGALFTAPAKEGSAGALLRVPAETLFSLIGSLCASMVVFCAWAGGIVTFV